MPYTVYVLRSGTTGRRYIGQTACLQRRLAEHADRSHNRRKYTSRQKGPWELIHRETYETRAEAMRRERFLKSGKGCAWLEAHADGACPPWAD